MKNKKYWWSVVGAALIVLACFIAIKSSFKKVEREVERATRPLDLPKVGKTQKINPDGTPHRDRDKSEPRQKQFSFVATSLSDSPKGAEGAVYPKYRTGGSGTRGSIRDGKGKLIWRATTENPVYSISISPDDKHIVVGAGDGNAYIVSSKGQKIVDLPQVPPGQDMLGLGNWIWFENNRLLGESGVQRFDENGKLVTCCGGDNVSESRFYVYDLLTDEMNEMQLPKELRGKVLSIEKVLKTGEFQFIHKGDKPSWCKVVNATEEGVRKK